MIRKILVAALCLILVCVFTYVCCLGRPVIYAPNIKVAQGTTRDVYEGMKALDAKDGDITDNIELVSGDLDTSKKGKYRLGYTVTDSSGKTVRANRVISVKGDPKSIVGLLLIISLSLLAVLTGVLLIRCIRERKRCFIR